MRYKAVIEMVKGENRRIHMSYDNSGFIDLGPIKEQIPINEGIMPIDYGYMVGTLNKDEKEKDAIDAIIFSTKQHKTGDEIDVEIIGVLIREDGDHKLIATDDSVIMNDFSEVPEQERKMILDYFGYKSKVISVENKENALKFLISSFIS